jgi:alanine racemase
VSRCVSELRVHDDAVRANTAVFAAATGGRLMAVLKADAFGHGPVVRAVLEAGARSVGVTSVDEALAIRVAGVTLPVLSWLNGVDADFDAAVRTDVDLAVAGREVLQAVAGAAARCGRPARVHLHVDVGMAREGCPVTDWPVLCDLARELQGVGAIVVVGVMGHMSSADRPADPQNVRERLLFRNAVRTARRRGLRPRVTHLAATAATLTGVGDGFDLHRIGAGLFGIDPSGTSSALRPALSLTTQVAAAREVEPGTGVGYGLDHVVDRRTNLALLPIGYGDGLPRAASERAEVLVRGRRRPLVGRFSMDMVVVDTGDDRLDAGETVTVFGPGAAGEPTVAEWAAWSDTIEHEIVTRIGTRVARVHRSTAVGRPTTDDTDAAPARTLEALGA